MKNLFTVSHVTKSCNISRATVLRLEKRGLVQPAYIDKESGYRYYDNHNITRILQIRHLSDIGLSYEDIYEYFNTSGKSKKLLNSLEIKMNAAKRTYEEMKLKIENKPSLTFETVNLPEYTCYVKEFSSVSVENKYNSMYSLFRQVIEKGLRPLPSEPLFAISKNTGIFGKIEDSFICCIPIESSCTAENITVFKPCKAFSCLYYGSYDNINDVYKALNQKIKELKLETTDYPRTLGIVAPYTAKEFNPNSYISRIAVPIKDFKE